MTALAVNQYVPTQPIAQLLSVVGESERPHDLIAVGTALHTFTDPVRATGIDVDLVELHRATTVLTKQVARVLDSDDRLERLAALVTDESRPATVDGRTARTFCGTAWDDVHAIAVERMEATISGAAAFGETAILRLAATRAADTTAPWWGTPAWQACVGDATSIDRRTAIRLLHSPETASSDDLRAILAPERPLHCCTVHHL